MESQWSKEALEASSQGCLFLSKHGVFNREHRSQVEITKKESHVTHKTFISEYQYHFVFIFQQAEV